MGRKNKNKNKERYDVAPQKKVKTNHWDQDKKPIYLTQFANPIFKRFYQLQFPFLNDQQFQPFWETLSLPLPVTFRINPTQIHHQNLIARLKDGSLTKEMVEEECEPIKEIAWYPGGLVWESKVPKKSLRKSAQLQKLHQFIQKCNSTGLLTRQELVSMLPPLLLDLKPTDYVLDMCAAPGSKTAQILETVSKGLVIANDVDAKRGYMLSHQLSRTATAQVMVTNYAAQFYPSLYVDGQRVQFDKILCDVPCTGDGAARKLPNRWVKWSARDANVIHPLQLSILMRALQMCKLGGYVMYSTCSLNPIEDEAVVTEVFRRAGFGCFELIDLHTLDGFISHKGLDDWRVLLSDDILSLNYFNYVSTGEDKEFFENMTEEDTIYEVDSIQDKDEPKVKKVYEKQQKKQEYQLHNSFKSLKASLWPEKKEFMQKMKIENTMRVLPHDQDTGGFYLALFKKTDSIIWKKPQYDEKIVGKQIEVEQKPQIVEGGEDQKIENEIDEDQLQEILKRTEEQQEQKKINKEKQKALLEPYTEINDFDWKVICDYYGIQDFPKSQVLGTGQSLDPILQVNKKFRYVSKDVQQILTDEKNIALKLINIGCKIFERGKESFGGQVSPFRICQEGLHYILPYVTKRKVECSKADYLDVVKRKNFRLEENDNQILRDEIAKLTAGCFVLYFKEDENTEAVVCQYFRGSVSLMCSAECVENILIRHNLI